MARITRDIKALAKNTLGLTVDVASAGLTVASGTASFTRSVVQSMSKENVQNVLTYTTDVALGNAIGTANSKLQAALDSGEFGKLFAEWALDTIHGKKAYRDAVAIIQAKIDTAEDELDLLMNQIELADLELEATKEIAKLNKQAEAAKQSKEA